MKTVLLPTDFSKNSVNAINYAMRLLHDVPCEFHILNVQKASSFISDDLMTMSSSATIYQTLIETAKKSIENLIRSIQTKYNNDKHNFNSVVDYDNFVDAINQMCAIHKIDVIIMGTKGATGAERILFGSNTMRIMQRCTTPVLAIPENCKFKDIDSIVFISDYRSKYKSEELNSLVDIAKLFNAKIDVLHLVEEKHLSQEQENNKAFVDKCFRKVTHEFVDVEDKDLYQGVTNYIEEHDVKMLAMMNRKHSFYERLFTKHNVENLGYKIKTPFLVMEDTGSFNS